MICSMGTSSIHEVSDLSRLPKIVQHEVATIETYFSNKHKLAQDVHSSSNEEEHTSKDSNAAPSSSGFEACKRSQFTSLGNKSSSR